MLNKNIFANKKLGFITIFLSVILAIQLCYFTERSDFNLLLFNYLAFSASLFLTFQFFKDKEKILFYFGLILKFALLFSIPNLSQDFYRFIWDGRLIVLGYNPYLHLPNDLMQTNYFTLNQADFLWLKMGNLSASHYSNYPPVNQLIFAIPALFFSKSIFGSVVFLKSILIIADLGIFFYGKKILSELKLNQHNIFFYFLNPLVIIELNGNLHFEGVMLFFWVAGFYCIIKERLILCATLFAISISVKLLPLILIPIFVQKLGIKKMIQLGSIVLGLNILFYFPFWNEKLIANYTNTIGLWFTNFEFNASFYYVIREIGFYIKGYNIIQTLGKISPFIMISIILVISFFRTNKTHLAIAEGILWILTIYLFQSTTVHPWYIINLVLLSIFTTYRFPLIWSVTAILSYYAYSNANFKENYLLLFMEYTLVIGFMIFEITKKRSSISCEN